MGCLVSVERELHFLNLIWQAPFFFVISGRFCYNAVKNIDITSTFGGVATGGKMKTNLVRGLLVVVLMLTGFAVARPASAAVCEQFPVAWFSDLALNVGNVETTANLSSYGQVTVKLPASESNVAFLTLLTTTSPAFQTSVTLEQCPTGIGNSMGFTRLLVGGVTIWDQTTGADKAYGLLFASSSRVYHQYARSGYTIPKPDWVRINPNDDGSWQIRIVGGTEFKLVPLNGQRVRVDFPSHSVELGTSEPIVLNQFGCAPGERVAVVVTELGELQFFKTNTSVLYSGNPPLEIKRSCSGFTIMAMRNQQWTGWPYWLQDADGNLEKFGQ